MTPTTADKVKEIINSFYEFYDPYSYAPNEKDINDWIATKEGSRLVGELVEDGNQDDLWDEIGQLLLGENIRQYTGMMQEIKSQYFITKIN